MNLQRNKLSAAAVKCLTKTFIMFVVSRVKEFPCLNDLTLVIAQTHASQKAKIKVSASDDKTVLRLCTKCPCKSKNNNKEEKQVNTLKTNSQQQESPENLKTNSGPILVFLGLNFV